MTHATRSADWYVKPVDAFRVLLCLYVIVFHAHLQSFNAYRFAALSQGIAAVNVFFVISGFGLMTSFLRGGGEFTGGFRAYAARRALRLLPLYYVCLLLSAASVLLFSIPYDPSLLSPGTVLAHVLLVQNYLPEGAYAINSTYWFVAVEAQLYVLFPFLALSWKRFGAVPTALGVVSVAGALWLLFNGGTLFARPQLPLVFLMGMGAASLVSSARQASSEASRTVSRWSLATMAASSVVFAWAYAHRAGDVGLPFAALARDLSSGAFGAAAIVWASLSGARSPARSALEHRAFAVLAPLMYAAYMAHDVLLRYVTVSLQHAGLDFGFPLFASVLAIGLPVVAVASVALHAALEKPLLRMRRPDAPERVV